LKITHHINRCKYHLINTWLTKNQYTPQINKPILKDTWKKKHRSHQKKSTTFIFSQNRIKYNTYKTFPINNRKRIITLLHMTKIRYHHPTTGHKEVYSTKKIHFLQTYSIYLPTNLTISHILFSYHCKKKNRLFVYKIDLNF